jgi:hypothetical protein
VLRIDRGHFGDVKLDGSKVALLYAWPGPIFEGKGEMQVIVDEHASERQRDALMKIVHGAETDEGATHWWVYRSMTDTVHETLIKPIEFDVDLEGRAARVVIPGVLESVGRPIVSPATGQEHRVRIDIPNGIEFERAEIGSATTSAVGAIRLDLTTPTGSSTDSGTPARASFTLSDDVSAWRSPSASTRSLADDRRSRDRRHHHQRIRAARRRRGDERARHDADAARHGNAATGVDVRICGADVRDVVADDDVDDVAERGSVLLLVSALNRKASPDRRPYGATALFAAGYLVALGGFQRRGRCHAGVAHRERQPVVDARRW